MSLLDEQPHPTPGAGDCWAEVLATTLVRLLKEGAR